MVDARHDPQQRRFAGAVRAEDADLGAGIKRQPDTAQNLPRRRDDFAQILHYIDELRWHATNLRSAASHLLSALLNESALRWSGSLVRTPQSGLFGSPSIAC